MPYNNTQMNAGSYVPTSYVWDVQQLNDINVNSPEFKELLVRLYQNLSLMANVLNSKESAFYVLEEFVTSQKWFNPNSNDVDQLRGSFRRVYNIGALGIGGTYPHNLATTTDWKFINIYGCASDTTTRNYYPMNFIGGAGYIELRADGTNIIINNTTGVTFNNAYVVLEYLKY